MSAIDDPQFFFVGGQGKSGTTWLQLLLDAHPAISCRGEGHLVDFLIPNLVQAVRNYNQQLNHNNQQFQELAPYPLLQEAEARALLRDAIKSRLRMQTGGKQLPAVGERTPVNSANFQLLHQLLPGAKFIHVLRDPRDVAVSMWFHGQRVNPEEATRNYGSLEKLVLSLIDNWKSSLQSVRASADPFRNDYLEIRYEDLKSGPDALQNIFKFLGVEESAKVAGACIEQCSFRKLSGGRREGEENRSSHFRKGIVGDWRNHVSEEAVARIDDMHGDFLQQEGYSGA